MRNGGQLVIGIGQSGAKIEASDLAEIMPLTGIARSVSVDKLDGFLRQYAELMTQFESPIPVAVGKPVDGAIVTLEDRLPDHRRLNLIALKCFGSGRVIASAARVRDLLSVTVNDKADRIHAELLDLNRNDPTFLESEKDAQYVFQTNATYLPIMRQIEFLRRASVLVMIAFLFVAAYIVFSTFGSWTWLKRRSLTQASWTIFAGFAIAASAMSLGAVWLSRGVTADVNAYSFIDLEAGSGDARASTFFGYKSNRRQKLDLSVPGPGNYLRPLSPGPDVAARYSTPDRYEAVPSSAELNQTPLRATLKQFESFWSGTADGMIRGELTADRRSGRIRPESWLVSDLEIDLEGGYLLYIDPRLSDSAGDVPPRIAGVNRRTDRADVANRYWNNLFVPPAINVLAVELPQMTPGTRVSNLGAREYAEFDTAYVKWAPKTEQDEPDPTEEPMLPTLWEYQVRKWEANAFPTVFSSTNTATDAAAVLVSTRNLYLHSGAGVDFTKFGSPITTAGLVDQDITHWLVRGQAVLLLVAADPGPAQLHVGGRPIETESGRSLYRVRIPIDYKGRPPTRSQP